MSIYFCSSVTHVAKPDGTTQEQAQLIPVQEARYTTRYLSLPSGNSAITRIEDDPTRFNELKPGLFYSLGLDSVPVSAAGISKSAIERLERFLHRHTGGDPDSFLRGSKRQPPNLGDLLDSRLPDSIAELLASVSEILRHDPVSETVSADDLVEPTPPCHFTGPGGVPGGEELVDKPVAEEEPLDQPAYAAK